MLKEGVMVANQAFQVPCVGNVVHNRAQVFICNDDGGTAFFTHWISTLVELTRTDCLIESIRLFFVVILSITDNLKKVILNVFGIINDVFIVFVFDLIGILGDGSMKTYVTLLKPKDSFKNQVIVNKWSIFFKIWSFLSMMKNNEKNKYLTNQSIQITTKAARGATTTKKSNRNAIKAILIIPTQAFRFFHEVSNHFSICRYFSDEMYNFVLNIQCRIGFIGTTIGIGFICFVCDRGWHTLLHAWLLLYENGVKLTIYCSFQQLFQLLQLHLIHYGQCQQQLEFIFYFFNFVTRVTIIKNYFNQY